MAANPIHLTGNAQAISDFINGFEVSKTDAPHRMVVLTSEPRSSFLTAMVTRKMSPVKRDGNS